MKSKPTIEQLSKKLTRMQRTIGTQRREIEGLRKADERRFFSGNSYSADAREDAFRPATSEDYLQLYENYVHVFSCINAIARNCAKLPIRLYELKKMTSTKDRRGNEITDGPIWNLLNQPNKFTSGFGLIYAMVAFTKLTGISYVEKVGSDPLNPVELWTLRPDWMKINVDAVELIGGYEYVVDGRIISYKPEEILRFKEWHPRSELYGLSHVSPAANAIVTDLYCAKYTKQFFKQGGHINWYLSVKDEEIPDTEMKRMQQELKTKFAGLENAHVPAIFTNDAQLKELGQNPDRNTLLPQKTLSRDEACEAFGVPALMLGLPNETHYNNAEAQKMFFWEETIQPIMRELIATLNREIFWPLDIDAEEDYSGVSVLQPNNTALATTSKTLVDGRIMLPNETRKRFFNLDPIPGGDAFPQAQAPFGQPQDGPLPVIQSKQSDLGLVIKIVELLLHKGGMGSGHHAHLPAPDGGRGSSPKLTEAKLKTITDHLAGGRHLDAYDMLREHGISTEQSKRIIRAAQHNGSFKEVMDELGIQPRKACVPKRLKEPKNRQDIVKAVVAHRDKIAAYVGKKLEPWAVDGYRRMGEAVMGVVGKISKAVAVIKADIVAEAIASLDPVTLQMAEELLAAEKGMLAQVIADEYMRAKGVEIDPEALTGIVDGKGDQLKRMVDESMKSITQTVKDRTEAKLTGLLDSNASLDDITKEFQDMFTGTEREGSVWARMVARTESLKFTESSRFSALAEAGFKEKEWIHSGNDHAREDHLVADGEHVPMNEAFSVQDENGYNLMYPGDPKAGPGALCNCGCTFTEYVPAAPDEEPIPGEEDLAAVEA